MRVASTLLRPILLCVVLLLVESAAADTAAKAREFFRQKTITYLVANKPGGGYDAYARLLAAALERKLPGTRVRVRNVPGAGSIVGANRLYVARPDGLTIGTFNSGLIYAQLIQMEGVRFDLTEFGWIGKAAEDPRVLIVSTHTSFRSIDDLRRSARPVLFGTPGVGSASHNETMMVARLLGLSIRPVAGLSGSERTMSMLRGEIEANLGSASTNLPFVEQGRARAVLRIGSNDSLPAEVPEIRDISAEDPEVVDLIEAVAWLGRLTAAPPGMEATRLEYLREVYGEAMRDRELLSEAARLGLPILPADGAEVSARLRRIISSPGVRRALLKSLASEATSG